MTLILVLRLTQVCALLTHVFTDALSRIHVNFILITFFSELYHIIFSLSLVCSFLGHKYY